MNSTSRNRKQGTAMGSPPATWYRYVDDMVKKFLNTQWAHFPITSMPQIHTFRALWRKKRTAEFHFRWHLPTRKWRWANEGHCIPENGGSHSATSSAGLGFWRRRQSKGNSTLKVSLKSQQLSWLDANTEHDINTINIYIFIVADELRLNRTKYSTFN